MDKNIFITVRVDKHWHEVETDLSECASCNEVIFGKMYEMVAFMYLGNSDLPQLVETGIKVCSSCLNCIKDE